MRVQLGQNLVCKVILGLRQACGSFWILGRCGCVCGAGTARAEGHRSQLGTSFAWVGWDTLQMVWEFWNSGNGWEPASSELFWFSTRWEFEV